MDYQGTFVVQYPNLDKGNKMSPVKDQQGQTWFVYKDKAAQLQPGMTVSCVYSIGEMNDRGETPYFVKKINNVNGTVPPTPAPQPAAAHTPQPAQPQPPATENDPLAENIFVTGVVARAMGSGQFGIDAVAQLTNAALHAWRTRQPVAFSKGTQQALDDSIPF